MSGLSPAIGNNLQDAGDAFYDSSSDDEDIGTSQRNAAAAFGDESDSYEEADDGDNADTNYDSEDYEEDDTAAGLVADAAGQRLDTLAEAQAQAGGERRVRGDVAASAAVSESLSRLVPALELLVAKMSIQSSLLPAVKLTAEQVDSGVMHRPVVFVIETSLEKLNAKGSDRRLQLRGINKEIFGCDQMTIQAIDITGVHNKFPVSFFIDAEHLPGKKVRDSPTVINALVMVNAPKKASVAFPGGKRVYESTENDFARDFAIKYPNYNADNLTDDISPLHGLGFGDKFGNDVSLVPRTSPIMSTIKEARGTVDNSTYLEGIDRFVVSNTEIMRAANATRHMLVESSESTKADDVYLTFGRSNLTQDSILKLGSNEAEPWVDTAEVAGSLKYGQKLDNEFGKVCELQVEAIVTYRPLKGDLAK